MNKFRKPVQKVKESPQRKEVIETPSEEKIEELIQKGDQVSGSEDPTEAFFVKAKSLIKAHVLISTGLALVPVPLLDIAGVTANQLLMLQRISALYGIKFKKSLAKSLISVLIYDLAAKGAVQIGGSLLKSIPGIGSFAGGITLSVTSAAITYAIGQVFIQHFEAGGTFLDFDPQQVKDYFKEQVEEGKNQKKTKTQRIIK